MVMDKFEIFYDQSIQCEWYLFPLEIQRIFLIFINDLQMPVFIRGYGGISMTRDTFKQVSHFYF